jgi:hypothetical protein
MHDEIYSDGVEEITVTGNIVRVDLISLSPTERDANNNPKKIFRQRLIFSAEAFANSVEVMQSALRGLVDAGVVARGQPLRSVAEPVAAAERATSTVSNIPRSPNASSNFR